jgi:hypothetical protein
VHATMPSKTLLLRPTKGCFASEAFARGGGRATS